MGLGGRDRRDHACGRRRLACDRGPAAAVRPRGRLARPAADLFEPWRHNHDLAWRFCGGCVADRGGGGDRGGDRDPLRPLRGRVPRRLAGGRSRGRAADRGRHHGRPGCGPGPGGPGLAMGIGHPVQRSRPLREGPGRGAASHRAGARTGCLHVGAARADRGGQQDRADPAGRRRARPAGRGHQHRPDRLGAGIYARCRALLSDGEDAETSYREAVDRLGRTRLRPELARAHLLYGEWLRREGRRADARAQLRTAHEMFAAIGMRRSPPGRRELPATGETARQRNRGRHGRRELTPQEAQIARLARVGPSNPEVAARLFLSPRTVEYHLKRCTQSSASAPAASSTKRYPAAAGTRRSHNGDRAAAPRTQPGHARLPALVIAVDSNGDSNCSEHRLPAAMGDSAQRSHDPCQLGVCPV